eukprot:TRINITY_DN8978_c0_g1_i2.p1 TRINITY_DN8978_c0_g1~~TRINITY_DN8978_c0_g1_i2.p1  ORF type:complete len:339 (-),score=46.63 TRINITY_DN8978_c0_g1_i2:156-1172(-)
MNQDVEAQQLGNASLFQSRFARMSFCVFGILSAFVLYGLLQERIMTQPYGEEEIYFKSSAYLVLNNRIVAMILAIVIMRFRGESLVNAAPIHKCASISVSNTLATYCQYEALKYVSFPTQTLGKCGKMIPVIILGLLIGGKKYTMNDFAIALLVTFGCTIFVTTGNIADSHQGEDSGFGLALMGGYLFCDGFTSVFQEKLFRGYSMSTYNQMLYVNLSSAVISLTLLVVSGELLESIQFTMAYPGFMFNSVLLSICAAGGQVIIYYSIKEFGALFFSTVMTTRQIISMLLSSIIYLHPLSFWQWAATLLVFGALFYKEALGKKHHHHTPSSAGKPERV